jgi:hypothetical protein
MFSKKIKCKIIFHRKTKNKNKMFVCVLQHRKDLLNFKGSLILIVVVFDIILELL